tara:strand:+ start:843 stop:1166 length:324 start_codon:yes stop_codon:yes gene_type:complete
MTQETFKSQYESKREERRLLLAKRPTEANPAFWEISFTCPEWQVWKEKFYCSDKEILSLWENNDFKNVIQNHYEYQQLAEVDEVDEASSTQNAIETAIKIRKEDWYD